MAGSLRQVLHGKEDRRTPDRHGHRTLPSCTDSRTPLERPHQANGKTGSSANDFVHVTPKERPLPLTLSAVSRYMVLRGQHTPAVIPDQQMERFRFMLDYSPEAVSFSATSLAPGDPIRVIKGPLTGLEGELITLHGKHQVVIRIDLLGCAHVEIPVGYVEKIAD